MIDFTSPLVDSVLFGNKIYHINLAFDVVLNVYKILKDNAFTDLQRIDLAAELLIKEHKNLNPVDKINLVKYILDNVISCTKKADSSSNNVKAFDFFEDAPYIYAAFLENYQIDLIEQKGELHWFKFIALFNGLSDKTKLREIISIRVRPLPEPTKYNAKEIAMLSELKRIYALDIPDSERENNFNSALSKLAGALIAKGGS